MPSSLDGGRAWVGVAAFFAIASIALFLTVPSGAVDWRPALAGAEPWRAWSAALVHLSALHLAANGAGAIVTGWLGWVARVPWRSAIAWLVAWPLTQLGLLARPDLVRFAGLSGVLHAGVACVAVALVANGRERRRAIGAAILAVLVTKVASEAPWAEALAHPAGWDIATAPFAHASGLVVGLVAAVLGETVHRRRARTP